MLSTLKAAAICQNLVTRYRTICAAMSSLVNLKQIEKTPNLELKSSKFNFKFEAPRVCGPPEECPPGHPDD